MIRKNKSRLFKLCSLGGIALITLGISSCKNEAQVTNNVEITNNDETDFKDESSKQYEIFKLAQQAGYDRSYEEWLETIRGESAYEIYCKYYPNYNENEEQWIEDLINGKLYKESTSHIDSISETGQFEYATYAADSYILTSYSGKDRYIQIPAYYNDFKVSVIGPGSFLSNKTIDEVVLSDNINEIQENAFYESSIRSVVFGNGLVKMGAESFYKCQNITSVVLPSGIQEIGSSCFSNCSGLNSIIFPNSLQKIEMCCFYNCKKLKEINIPDSVTSIGNSCFNLCSSLSKITLGKGLTIIGNQVFEGCGVEHLIIPKNVIELSNRSFYSCTNLESIQIEKGLEIIGDNVFAQCSKLKTINLPSSLKKIGSGVFASNKILLNIDYDGTIEQWGLISKDSNWLQNSSISTIVCKDGTITI